MTIASLILPVLLAATAGLAPLERGVLLPIMPGELLTGTHAELPAVARGKVTLVAVGFTRGSSKAVEAYSGHFKVAFAADSTAYDWLEVPLVGGMARMMKPLITGGMRGGTPVPDRRHVMTVWTGSADWKQRLGFREGDWAYLVLLDREGHVRWHGAGVFDEGKWRELEAAAREAR